MVRVDELVPLGVIELVPVPVRVGVDTAVAVGDIVSESDDVPV